MVQFAIIIVIIISLVAGIYGVVLLGNMRKKYQSEFQNSFFYYQILFIVFGIYGILGNLAVQEILLKFDIKDSTSEAIAHFFPFFGVPFILAAWYIMLKLSAEIAKRKVPQYVAIVYFALTTSAFLIYGRLIQRMPEYDYPALTRQVTVVFYTIDIIVGAYAFLIIMLHAVKEKKKSRKVFLFRFAVILASLALLRGTSMHFAESYMAVGLYFILLFFAGNLSLILLTKVYLLKYSSDFLFKTKVDEDLCLKYGISKREKQIIEEICKGKTNQQIADDLFITLQTVKDHTHNIYKKTKVKNRVQLSQVFNSFG